MVIRGQKIGRGWKKLSRGEFKGEMCVDVEIRSGNGEIR